MYYHVSARVAKSKFTKPGVLRKKNQELTRRFLLKIRRKFRRFLLKSGSFLVVFLREKLGFSLIRMIVILS
jgi:hypothetical protein